VPERDIRLNEALEHFLLALWDQVGEEGTDRVTLKLRQRAVSAIERAYPSNRMEWGPNSTRIIRTAMGDVRLEVDRENRFSE
jgi:hypothetical protein